MLSHSDKKEAQETFMQLLATFTHSYPSYNKFISTLEIRANKLLLKEIRKAPVPG